MSKKDGKSKTINVYYFHTPMGRVFTAADESFLYVLMFEECAMLKKKFSQICDQLDISVVLEIKSKILDQLERELAAYFDGTLKKCTVSHKIIGTRFQEEVWTKLRDLPYGTTYSYSDFAYIFGCSASFARAIGNVCANNVLLLLIPCHRVVAVGSRGGYNSGAERKEWLIKHEKKHAD